LIAISIAASWNQLSAAPPPQDARLPNVIVILVDDLGRADLGRRIEPGPDNPPSMSQRGPGRIHRETDDEEPFGPGDFGIADADSGRYAHTPWIDRFFDQGIELTQYLTHNLCSPSRAGLLTGRHYTRVGSGPETTGTLDLEVSNLARDLKSAGYVTAAFGKWHNGYPNFPADGNGVVVAGRSRTDPENDWFENYKGIAWGPGVNAYGFDEWQGFYGGATDYFNRFSSWDNDINWWTNRSYTPIVEGHTVDLVSASVVDFISRHRDRPFFCFVPMPAPHEPLHVLRSDLEALSSQFSGAWRRVRDLTSPTTGRRIDEAEQLRCGPGEEFDHTVLDPEGREFRKLARASLVYALDRGVGEILSAIESLGLSEDTIVWFMSDNGGNNDEASYPLRGKKGSLYEGGIRVPAAVWWHGTLDSLTPAYAAHNSFPFLFQYLDVYPTTIAMTGVAAPSGDLDGRNGLPALIERQPVRPPDETAFVSFNRDLAVARSGRWKLLYNEAGSRQQIELYDMERDILEKSNLHEQRPEISRRLAVDLHRFMSGRQLSMSFFPPRAAWIGSSEAQPRGDILEIQALQTRRIKDPDSEGLFVRFASGGIGSYNTTQLESGDLLSFDLFVEADSDHTAGLFVTPGRGAEPIFDSQRGVIPEGTLVAEKAWPRQRWLRVIIGIGEIAPLPQTNDYIALRSLYKGSYHFFIDNVEILRADGSTKAVVWASSEDTKKLRYRWGGITYSNWEDLVALQNFPFSSVSIGVR
jgi:arylsulfatase A-like enzyme